MRLSILLATAAILSVSALPAWALEPEEAAEIYENADLSEEAHVALWCGAAFYVASEQTKPTDEAGAAVFMETATTLINKADALMTEEGMALEDVRKVQEAYGFQVAVQIMSTPDETDFTQEECQAEVEAE